MNFLDREQQIEIFKDAIRGYEARHQQRSLYPLGDNWGYWLPLSAKNGDICLALLLMRFSRKGAQVGVFLCEDHHTLPAGSAAWLAVMYSLSAAYFRTGSFALEFVSLKKERGRLREVPGCIPVEFIKLGSYLNCSIQAQTNAELSRLTDEEGKLLYIGLGNLSGSTIAGLGNDRALILQAALLYRRGVWTKQSLEYIARFSFAKRSVLFGTDDVLFWESSTSAVDCDLLEIAVAGERVRGWLAWQMRDASFPMDSVWVDSRTLSVTPLAIPPLGSCKLGTLRIVDDYGQKIEVAAGSSLYFFLVPGHVGYYELFFNTIMTESHMKGPVVLVVTQDMRDAPRAIERLLADLKSHKLSGVFYLPEVVEEISNEVSRRLKLASSTAQDPPELHE